MSFDFDASRKPGAELASSQNLEWCNHVLVIISNRFGLNSVSQEYFKVIKKYMRFPSFMGLVGGKPRFAYYFVGHLEKPAGLPSESQSAQNQSGSQGSP